MSIKRHIKRSVKKYNLDVWRALEDDGYKLGNLIDDIIINSIQHTRIKKFNDELDILYSAHELNVCEFVRNIVNANNIHFYDLKIGSRRNIYNLNDEIKSFIVKHGFENRKFIYISWKKRPQLFFYVGKASSIQRMKLFHHGKLLESLKEASTLSFLVPVKNTEDTVRKIESAFIDYFGIITGKLPKFNDKLEITFDGSGTKILTQISKNMKKILHKIESF